MSAHELHSPDVVDRRGELRSVLLLSLPMVVTTCSPMVMRVADFAFISTLGTDAQAAIIPAQITLWCYMAMCIGLVSAVSTYAAQCLGRGRRRECSAYAWQSLYLSVALGLVGCSLWWAFPTIFDWIGHAPAVKELEIRYTRVSVWAVLPTVAAQALGAFFNGIHRPKVTMMAAVESNALNIVLNYAFIFGAWGFPRLGFTGAALGTVAAAIYQMLRLSANLWWGEAQRAFDSRHTWQPDWAKIRGLWRVGAPQALHWLSDVTVWALFSVLLIGRFGTTELAATNIAWQYIRIGFMPMIGVGQALTSLVGKAIGQGNPLRAVRLTAIGVILCLVYTGALSALYVFYRRALVGVFSDDAAVLELGAKVMCCVALFLLFDVIGQAYYHALRGAGDTRWPMIVFVVSHWAVVIGGGFAIALLRPDLGSLGPWVMATALISLTGVLLWWRWRSRAWMRIDLFQEERAAGPRGTPVSESHAASTADRGAGGPRPVSGAGEMTGATAVSELQDPQ